MGFHEVQFPPEISRGSSGGAGANVNIIELMSGVDQAVDRWSRVRHRYDVRKGVRTHADLSVIRTFFYARKGPANGFRFKDWHDFHSNPTDPTFRSSAGVRDQDIGTGDGSETDFQLKKTYISGLTPYVRNITKPVAGTVRVWLDGVEQTEGVHFTVDTTTGVVTFSTPPGVGVVIEASFQFDVPVRFDLSPQSPLSAILDDVGWGSIPSIPVVEMFDPDPGYVSEFFYGGSTERAIGANITLSTGIARLWSISASTTGLSVLLPDPADIPTGGPIFWITNEGVNSFTVKDHLGATLTTLTQNTGCVVLLTVDNLGSKVWVTI